ncbi:alpha/beta hydrolase [Klebsiella aerogenes]|uniref:alpha/beta hydrolase n=1 Tax=Klebsiella aerogenes TaxID=548 RepID=UPI00398C79A6|nr:alpha/beta hydrolase [Klebsiella aerogenes]
MVIFHGYTATPASYWFQWLKQQATASGFEVILPAMPTPESPEVTAWPNKLESTLGQPDENAWFVGHNLGSIAILRYLTERVARMPDWRDHYGYRLPRTGRGPGITASLHRREH